MKVAIVGAGNIGRALGKVLDGKKGLAALYSDSTPGKIRGQRPLAEAVGQADAVFLCIPSWAVTDAVRAFRPYLRKSAVVVCLSKGTGLGQTMDRLLGAVLPKGQPFALLYGSSLAGELAAGAGGFAVAAGKPRATRTVRKIFSGTSFTVTESADLRGVAVCGVLKNIYAIGLGALAALRTGHNLTGAYIAEAHREMGGIVALLGGRRATAGGPAGLGDLVTTGFSPDSRNWQTGFDMVKANGCRRESEGSRAAAYLAKLLGRRSDRFRLFRAIAAATANRIEPGKILSVLKDA